jgi:uncharacterized protein (DUF608 family)
MVPAVVTSTLTTIFCGLGQWWANQLNPGQIYPEERTKAGLGKIYSTNRYTDTGEGYVPMFRDFLGTGDTGWQMFMHTGEVPENTIFYYSEVMSGFEYAAAATMLQNGMIEEGLGMVKAISERYDGRLHSEEEVHMANNSCVFGTGSPFGEDECGDFFIRPLSSWSVLLALQGFIFYGPIRPSVSNRRGSPKTMPVSFQHRKGGGCLPRPGKTQFRVPVLK